MQVDKFENAAQVLQQLSESLPLLEHLDLSGTNLAGKVNSTEEVASPLPGWPTGRKLKFLGLYFLCTSSPCRRENLPALRVAGDWNEEQRITALEAYADAQHVTRHLLHFILCSQQSIWNINGVNILRAPEHVFELLPERMHRYLSDKYVQLYATALLVDHLLPQLGIENISPMRLRTLVQRLVDTLERYAQSNDPPSDLENTCRHIVQNCVRILSEIKVSSYHLLYERLLTVLFLIAQRPRDNFDSYSHLKVLALNLLHSVLLHPMHISESKSLFDKLDGLRVVLTILEQEVLLEESVTLRLQVCEQLAHKCWLLVSFATHKSPSNCQQFIDVDGLELFVNCVKRWPGSVHEKELKHAMLLALANIAELKLLRGYLMTDQLYTIFIELLDTSDANDNGISYNTARVLSHLLAEGKDEWHQNAFREDLEGALLPVSPHSRAAIGERIIGATARWNPDVACDPTITYTSLIPILSLITSFNSFASQYWAAWALNNLSLVNPDIYCPMLFREGALDILDTAIADARSQDRFRHWLVLTADRLRQHTK